MKRLAKFGRFRIFWLAFPPIRDSTRIFAECAYEPVEVEGMVGTGVRYIAIGRLAFMWFSGHKKGQNVLQFRRTKNTRPKMGRGSRR